ncbi:helix-turn-helix domain-containing protein [Flavobacterium sp. HNIBRBA15423]|uniref:helix-turn-helix domain-containing protein n=1 Tax=Flavobacterium sp. HNIBRBA15423 TaxID=3458683 RepID=UPI004044BD35
MEKIKLIEARKQKGFSQQQIAEHLCIDVSNYNRREKGQAKISSNEWEKIASLLNVPIEEIYESEESNFFVFRDNSIGNYLGTNHIYSIPEYLLESQRKYITKLEEEIKELKEILNKKEL